MIFLNLLFGIIAGWLTMLFCIQQLHMPRFWAAFCGVLSAITVFYANLVALLIDLVKMF